MADEKNVLTPQQEAYLQAAGQHAASANRIRRNARRASMFDPRRERRFIRHTRAVERLMKLAGVEAGE